MATTERLNVYETPEAIAEVHSSGWFRLPSGVEVTALPLIASSEPLLFAHLDYESALRVAARYSAELLHYDTVSELHDVASAAGTELEPHIIPADSLMSSIERCRQHDGAVFAELARRGWDGKTPVANAGKHWTAGAPSGRAYLRGWWQGGRFIQAGSTTGQGPHNDLHEDYATTTVLQRAPVSVSYAAPGALERGALERARADVGMREVSPNRGPRIDEMIRACGLQPPQYWCACAVSSWVHNAADDLGIRPPFPRTAGALNLAALLNRAGLLYSPAELRADPTLIVPGMVVVWRRPEGGPGAGHTGIVEEGLDRNLAFGTIEGNEGDQVRRMRRALHDQLLVGMGRLSRGDIEPAPTPEALAIAAQQLALSLALRDGVSGLDSLPSAEPNS